MSEQTNATIRAELARQEIKRAALAAHLGISLPSLRRRMSGAYSWRLDELTKVADLLGCDVRDLMPARADDLAHGRDR